MTYKPRTFKRVEKTIDQKPTVDQNDMQKNILEVKEFIQGEEFKSLSAERQNSIKEKAQAMLEQYKLQKSTPEKKGESTEDNETPTDAPQEQGYKFPALIL